MFVNDKVIYLQLQKTGCTHITQLLIKYLGGATGHKHSRLNQEPAGRMVIGSVRNPWDWYVSLWAYGCMGRGGIETQLTSSRYAQAIRKLRGGARRPQHWPRTIDLIMRQNLRHDTRFWRRVYADSSDRGAFREWLHAIHDPRNQSIVFEDSRRLQIHNSVGLYTSRLVYLYSEPAAWDAKVAELSDRSSIETFFDHHSVLDRTIRTEHLATDLAKVMQLMGRKDLTSVDLSATGRTNASKRDPFETYYDASSIALIANRDKMVIDRFGYVRLQPTETCSKEGL